MSNTKVTVVLNFFNEEKYLSQAIESILMQTYHNFELLLIDDASTDLSWDIAKRYNDPRIKIIRNSENRGLAYGRNIGMKMAQGEYIAFADGDDYSSKDRLEVEAKWLDEHKDVLAVSCWMKYIDENNVLITKRANKILKSEEIRAQLLIGNPISNPGSMIRRCVFEKYNIFQEEKLRVSQDYYFWLKVIQIGKIQIIPQYLLYYRIHNSKASQNAKENKDKYDEMMRKLISYAWKSQGIVMNEKDIEYIYKYFFEKNYIYKRQDLHNVSILKRNVYNQIKDLPDEEARVLKRELKKRFREIFIYIHPLKWGENRLAEIIKHK